MRMAGIEMRTWNGAPMFPLLAVMHALIFWFSVGLLTPLILLVGLFTYAAAAPPRPPARHGRGQFRARWSAWEAVMPTLRDPQSGGLRSPRARHRHA